MLKKITIYNASTHALIHAHPEDTLGDIYRKLCEHNAVVVIGAEGNYLGIVTRRDAVRAILDRDNWKDIPVDEIMTRDVLHIPNHVTLAEAADIMLKDDIHQLVVTGPPEGGAVAVGIVTLQDVLYNAV